jgi:peptide/nickel transport system permease protein
VGRFIVGKVAAALVTLLLALTIAFILGRMSGDPVYNILGPFAPPEQVAQMRATLGLDQPLWTQYVTYLADVLTGDLGQSLRYTQPNTTVIFSALPYSIELALAAVALALLVGVPLGVLGAVKQDTAWDRLASSVALLGQSVPLFWLGLVLILVFSVRLGVLPAGQAGTPAHLVLPAVTLSALPMAQIARLTRAAMIEVLHEPYIDAARARGLSRARLVFVHALRNAALPVLTITGLQTGILLAGAVTVEYVFGWPGIGTLAVQAVQFRDFTLVQSLVILGAITFVAVNLLIDLLYSVIDPRIRSVR